ncbi:uncharacterized protein LOC144174320 [Haemaphysalis longicornis]
MDLMKLPKSDLLLLCEELSVEVPSKITKKELCKIIPKSVENNDELVHAWNLVREAKEKAEQEQKRLQEESEREWEKEKERQKWEAEKAERELKRLELEKERRKDGGSARAETPERTCEAVSYRMDKYMHPYETGRDIGLYLGNFERTCERENFARGTWTQRLLTLLPCEVAEVIARLSTEDAADYEKVKASLLKRYRLSAEAFRQRFRSSSKGDSEGYPDFAYGLKTNLLEWLKGAGAYESRDGVVECICLEQFYRSIPQAVKLWVQDRENVGTVERAAELAEEYATRRRLSTDESASHARNVTRSHVPSKKNLSSKSSVQAEAPKRMAEKREDQSKREGADKAGKKEFEASRPLRCYNCNGVGHFAAKCTKPRVVFKCVDESDENLELLRPYLHKLQVNGKPCNVLRDSAATMDVVHPSYVAADDFTGEVAWIKQAVEEHSVCLPMARVRICGPFGELITEAAVSKALPLQYPYLFSNRSDRLLNEGGQKLGEGVVQALTRSKTRQLASQLSQIPEPKVAREARANLPLEPLEEEEVTGCQRQTDAQGYDRTGTITEAANEAESSEGAVLSPASRNFDRLLKVNRESLIKEQREDPTLERLHVTAKEGIARRNITVHEKGGLLYRHYQDKKGKTLDQLVVPERYRADILSLCHGNGWSGHLRINKTKERLLMEYYWPGCFKDVERYVKSCDACQRVGKSGETWKAPLKIVPLISEPFRRLVIDTVGPLPRTKSGYKYLLTMLCPATKFPEAIPLKELSSSEIVDALLSVFARIGFPAEIQTDQATVFTSALTTTFLERCGVKLLHSSVYHPQSNSVEKWHSVLKRVLRALCYEHKEDWEDCLPATLFALRTVPHEATGFTPAELVYGRALRSPLRMLREMWEGTGENQTVVEYVLQLLDRLNSTREIVNRNMKASQEASKVYYDKNARLRTFRVGDRVMILRPSRKNKLEVHWDGPVEVMQKLSETNYALKIPGRGKQVRIYHCNLMKPYMERSGIVNLMLNEPEELDSEILDWKENAGDSVSVEKIVALSVNTESLSSGQINALKRLLSEFADRFSSRPGKTHLLTHEIELTSDEPIRSKPYRVSPRQKEIMEAEIQRMLNLGVIEPAESDYTSPLILVEAPGKEPRPCVDYRKLNAITRDQLYPIPNIEERLERVSGAKFISTLDLVRGYWQVPLSESASRYAAFISPVGTFRPLMLSFGLKNAPFSFSKLMDIVLRDMQGFALPYLDDVAIFSETWEEHLEHLKSVFSRLREAGLTMKAEKCRFGCAHVAYLGHVVGQGTRSPSELKIAPIVAFPQPRTKTDIRSFLGLVGYYQRYIPNYSQLASPLTDALRKGAPTKVPWDAEKENAFKSLKAVLMCRPLLRTPDYSKEFIVQCDASDRGMGVVLSQVGDDREEHPILYVSRKLTCREETYSASEKECACLVWASQKLSCYLYGAKFIFETDHCPLTWLRQMSPKNGRLLRWSLALQEYNFSVRYKKGKLHANADGLSRLL